MNTTCAIKSIYFLSSIQVIKLAFRSQPNFALVLKFFGIHVFNACVFLDSRVPTRRPHRAAQGARAPCVESDVRRPLHARRCTQHFGKQPQPPRLTLKFPKISNSFTMASLIHSNPSQADIRICSLIKIVSQETAIKFLVRYSG